MSFRRDERTLLDRVNELEALVRLQTQAGAIPPDPGWVLQEVGDELQYLYVPTGAAGPIIGSR